MHPATRLPAPLPLLHRLPRLATAADPQADPKPPALIAGAAFFVPTPALAPGYSDFSPYLDLLPPGKPHVHAEHSTN